MVGMTAALVTGIQTTTNADDGKTDGMVNSVGANATKHHAGFVITPHLTAAVLRNFANAVSIAESFLQSRSANRMSNRRKFDWHSIIN